MSELVLCVVLLVMTVVAYRISLPRKGNAAPPAPPPRRADLEPVVVRAAPDVEAVALVSVPPPVTAPPPATVAPAIPSPVPPTTEPPAPVSKDSPSADPMMVVTYDEDEAGELEVTKVGALQEEVKEVKKEEVKKRLVYQPPVTRIVFDPEAEQDAGPSSRPGEPMFLVFATAQTDPGKRRKNNEDNLLVLEEENLFVVADGMGGYRGGELASELAIRTLEGAARSKKYEGPPHKDLAVEASELARAIQMANAEIQALAARRQELVGMGTTLCALRFMPLLARLYIGHVGDSRCYRLRDGVLRPMTSDHTMADHGVTGPESGNLSRAVGIWPTMPIDIIVGAPKVGDSYLLCSDGLTKMLADDVIANVLTHETDPKAAVDRLILFANSRGGKDNITVILVRVVSARARALKQTMIGL